MRQSRQERFTDKIETFVGNPNNGNLQLSLYPAELKRLSANFPELNFEVINTQKSARQKLHIVKITKK